MCVLLCFALLFLPFPFPFVSSSSASPGEEKRRKEKGREGKEEAGLARLGSGEARPSQEGKAHQSLMPREPCELFRGTSSNEWGSPTHPPSACSRLVCAILGVPLINKFLSLCL